MYNSGSLVPAPLDNGEGQRCEETKEVVRTNIWFCFLEKITKREAFSITNRHHIIFMIIDFMQLQLWQC